VWSVVVCVVSWVAAVVAACVGSCVVRPLLRLCELDGSNPLLGSVGCSAAGAVLCVVGTLCVPGAELCTVPGAVLCVVGTVCVVGAGAWSGCTVVVCGD
jgi:hypothetical protein